ncbi:hypothetical protein IJH02_00310 [Candidatus Saccharibacteria bacterium]|nr:hypothetical protein [Candidatus Saccharibacteria bacterium]
MSLEWSSCTCIISPVGRGRVSTRSLSPCGAYYTGYRNGGSVNNPSDNANYWSSTANSEVNAYNLNFNSDGNFNPQNNNNKYNGFAVRCVAASS